MAKFRKKPVVIEAVQFDSGSPGDVAAFVGFERSYFVGDSDDDPIDYMVIKTLEGDMRADDGDWIIKGVKGEFYPCKPDIFAATYEAVTDE